MSQLFLRAFFIFCLFSFANCNFILDEECLNYTVYPVQYELNIFPFVAGDRSYYDCELTITVIANAPNIHVIDLDAKDLAVQGSVIKFYDGFPSLKNEHALPYEHNEFTGKLHIYLDRPLAVYTSENKQFYYIKMSFRKYLKENSAGVFLVKYYDEQTKQFKYLFQTRLSPNRAKYFFPCFDNPRFEAGFKFRVYILKPINDVQFTNTSIIIAEELKRDPVKEDYTVIEYMPSPQVGVHQVVFHFSTFASTLATAAATNDTLVLWAPIDELNDFHFIRTFGIRMIDKIHAYSNTVRPLVQGPINLIAVPTPMDGYEIDSWNVLTNGAHKLATIDQFTSIKQIEAMMFELTQQLCRIWLGNPGEPQRTRWREEWFKEGVATYLAHYFLAQHNHGIPTEERQPMAGFGLRMKHAAMALDWHRSTPALDSFNSSLAIEIPRRYKKLVAMKTGAILWMLENWVESEKFHKSLKNYIYSRRGKYISLQDFTENLDRDTVECLHQFFNGSTASRILGSWFKRRGYPVIHVGVFRDRTPNTVQLKQRQFSFSRDNRGDTDFMIPISYIVQHNQNCFNCYQPRFTIGAQTYTFSENLDGGWILLNRKGSGYYRVNYDRMTWRLIARTLRDDLMAIHELNRAQIVNDAFALYVAEDIDVNTARDILDYLDKEPSPIVWEAVRSGYELMIIEGAAYKMTKQMYWEWEDFLIKKVTPIYNQLVKMKDTAMLSRLFRSDVIEIACQLNYEPCTTYVRRMYIEDKRGKHNLYPDCRLSYFYVLANETFSNTYSRKMNAIEQDDKAVADKQVRDKNRFLGKLPMGDPRPLPIIMTSTSEKPVEAVVEEQQPNGSTSVEHSLVILFISMCINKLIIRFC